MLQLQTAAPHGLQNLIKTTLSLGTADQVLQSDLSSPIRGKPYPCDEMSLRTPVLLFHTSGFLLGGGAFAPLGFGLPPLDMLRFLFYTQSSQAFIKALMTQ